MASQATDAAAINKAISVTALFENGQVKPLHVTWNDRVYHVTNVNSVWRQTVCATKYVHLAVETREGTNMELVIDPTDLSWRLQKAGHRAAP